MRRWTTILALATLLALLASMGTACKDEPQFEGRPVSEWVSLLRHSDWAMQQKASDALVRAGKVSIPYLRKGLPTKDPTLRRWCAVTLGRMGPDAVEAVPSLLSRITREEVPMIRAAILTALASIAPKDPKVVAEFEKRAARDVDEDVKRAAKAGLDADKPKPEEKKDQAKVMDQDLENWVLRAGVAKAVEAKKPGTAFALIAEVARDKRRAAIVWPALDAECKIIDDDVVAFIFEKKGDAFALAEEIGPLKGSEAAAKLAEALGGADGQKVIRPCGVAKDKLAGHLAAQGAAWDKALAEKKPAQAVAAFEALSRAFTFTKVAYDDAVIEMLMKGAFAEAWTLDAAAEGLSLPVEMKLGDVAMKGMLSLRPCGQGVSIANLEPAKPEEKKPEEKKPEEKKPE